MLVRMVRLHNFTSYRDTSIEFPREAGAIAIVGPNGAGKSSILDAIYYALYGESLRGNIRETVRAGAGEMEVDLLFEASGATYHVRRRVALKKRRHEVSAELTRVVDGREKLIARGAKEVSRAVEALLGVDKTMFISAYYVRQGEIAALLSMQPGERKKLITRLLGIEYFEKAYENMLLLMERFAKEHVDPLEKKVEQKEYLSGELKKLEERLREYREEERLLASRIRGAQKARKKLEGEKRRVEKELEELQEKSRRLTSLEAQKREVLKKVEFLEAQLSELEKIRAEFQRLKEECERLKPFYEGRQAASMLAEKGGELKELRRKASELTSKLEKIPRLRQKAELYNKLKRRLEELKEEEKRYNMALQELRSLEEDKKRLDSILKRIRTRLKPYLDAVGLPDTTTPEELKAALLQVRNKLAGEVKEYEERYREITQEMESLKARLSQLEKWLRGLSGISEARCPLCGRPLDEKHKRDLYTRYAAEAEDIKRKLSEKLEEANRVKSSLEAVKREYERILRLDPETGYELLSEYGEYRKEQENLVEAIKRKAEELRRMSGLEEKIKELEEQISSLEGDYIEYEFHSDRRPEYEKELAEIKAKINELEAVLKEASRKLASLGLLGKDPGEIIRGAELYIEYSARLRELENRLKTAEDIKSELGSTKKSLESLEREIARLRPEVEGIDRLEEKRRVLEQKLRELEQEIGKLSGKQVALREAIEEAASRISELQAKLGEIEEIERKLESAKKVLEDLEKIRRVFHKDGAPRIIRERAIPRIQRLTRELLEFFNLNIGDIIINEDFSIAVMDGGRERSITTLSGGEQVITALSLRLAIARSTSEGRSLLMFDEPTANLDEDRRRLLVDALKKLYREGEGPRQMIIVTHDRELEDAADIVYLVKRLPSGSLVERLEL